MKQSELIKQVNRDLEEEYDAADINEWLNRCLDDLTPVAKKEAKANITITVDNSFLTPADLHELDYVEVNDCEYKLVPIRDKSSTGYKLWDGQLSLQNGPTDGTIDLYYHKKLTHLANPDDVPEIEEEFHDLLILYAIGHLQFTEEDYDDRPDLLNRYQQRKNEFASYVAQQRYRMTQIQVVY